MTGFRSIVITGASSGIGAALAESLAEPGTALLLIARRADALTDVAKKARDRGAAIDTAIIDVRDSAALEVALLAFDKRHPIDCVIANAGIEGSLAPGRSAEPVTQASEQIRINLEGAINTVTPLIEPMRQRRNGTIALIASLAGFAPIPDQPAYSATKAGLIAWGEALIPWLRAYNVHVCIVCPGYVETGFSEHFRGTRPLEISAEDAARRIVRGLARRKPVIAFPFPLAILARLGMLFPSLRRIITNRMFRVEVRK